MLLTDEDDIITADQARKRTSESNGDDSRDREDLNTILREVKRRSRYGYSELVWLYRSHPVSDAVVETLQEQLGFKVTQSEKMCEYANRPEWTTTVSWG